MRARLKSGTFRGKDKKYTPGDIIDNFEENVPKSFHDMWEILPPRERREEPPKEMKTEKPKTKVTVKEPSTATTSKSTSTQKKDTTKK